MAYVRDCSRLMNMQVESHQKAAKSLQLSVASAREQRLEGGNYHGNAGESPLPPSSMAGSGEEGGGDAGHLPCLSLSLSGSDTLESSTPSWAMRSSYRSAVVARGSSPEPSNTQACAN